MTVKPSKAEEEYFARLEFEKKKKLAEKQMKLLSENEKEKLKNTHFMHCPKCGMDLIVVKYKDVEVDECPSCKGFWLDADEVEKIISEKDSFLSNVLKIFK